MVSSIFLKILVDGSRLLEHPYMLGHITLMVANEWTPEVKQNWTIKLCKVSKTKRLARRWMQTFKQEGINSLLNKPLHSLEKKNFLHLLFYLWFELTCCHSSTSSHSSSPSLSWISSGSSSEKGSDSPASLPNLSPLPTLAIIGKKTCQLHGNSDWFKDFHQGGKVQR